MWLRQKPVYRTALLIAGLLLASLQPPTLATKVATEHGTDTWFTVLLNGRKVGHAHFSRSINHRRVTTRQTMQMHLDRAGKTLTVITNETNVETVDGKPLRFRASTELSDMRTVIEGQRRADGRFDITRTVAGKSRRSTVEIPQTVLLAEGRRLAAQQAGRKPGTQYRYSAWSTASAQALPTDNKVVGIEHVTLPFGVQDLLRIEQSTQAGTSTLHSTLWVDPRYRVRRMQTSMLGMDLELLACSKTCAMAPDQGVDILQQAMVSMPRALSKSQRKSPIRYRFASTNGSTLHFAQTDAQTVTQPQSGTLLVEVDTAATARENPPDKRDRQATQWLQADNPELQELARRATAGKTDPAAKMQALEAFVSDYISSKNLDVGYASALEVMRQRRGDCTEHAVFLAALARSAGIPARVVTGLVYMPHFAGRDNVLVPHAWVQAWLGEHWQGYDAALRGFDHGHIALASGDGDPWHFFDAVSTLGRIKVLSVQTVQPQDNQQAQNQQKALEPI